MKIKIVLIIFLLTFASKPYCYSNNQILVGYWHNWEDANVPYIDLESIESRFDIIEVAFATPISNQDMTMQFIPEKVTQSTFISKIQNLKSKSKKILLSIGGANTSIDLTSSQNKTNFINSLNSLLETYSFDGIDIDIEHGNSILITGGTIASPTNVAQINLIDAIKQIMTNYRTKFSKKMYLTMAPETAYVQGGQSGFGSIWGGYLPIIHALSDSIDILQVQLYNSGSMYGIDGNVYNQGTADFIIAMTEAAIKGFNTNGGRFNGIPASKVAVGLPASSSAAGGGFVDSANVYSAMNYLIGKGSKPGSYTLVQSSGYTDLKGMMTWSINWDNLKRNNTKNQFANVFESIFYSKPLSLPNKVSLVSPINNQQIEANSTTLIWNKSSPNISNYHLELKLGNTIIQNDSTINDSILKLYNLAYSSQYNWRVRAKNLSGWGEWSEIFTFKTLPLPNKVELTTPLDKEQLETNNTQLTWLIGTPNVDKYHLELSLDGKIVISDSLISANTYVLTKLKPNSDYNWSIRAHNVAGWGEWSSSSTFSSLKYPEKIVFMNPIDNKYLDDNSVVLEWNMSKPKVTNYQISVYIDNISYFDDNTIIDTKLMLKNIKPNTKYYWTVRAKNESGWGEWSKGQYFHTLGIPSKTTLISPSNNSELKADIINFSWNTTFQKVEYYKLVIMYLDNSVKLDTLVNDTNVNIFIHEKKDFDFKWKVQGINNSGIGEWSDTYTFKKILAKYNLIVKNGIGSGIYYLDSRVLIQADDVTIGKKFFKWSGDTEFVEDSLKSETVVKIPSKDITLIAEFADASAIGDDINLSFDFIINHFKNTLTLNKNYDNEIIEIYNQIGIQVVKAEYKDGINIGSLPIGIYFVKCKNRLAKFVKY
ncbi:MAG: glycosyl hydrolase family 18 protein [Candidatus Kapabacteria bacterium]|nr:glycosyl hydrolase family 18 protein [Candidatus Kapabacteria bacterium]